MIDFSNQNLYREIFYINFYILYDAILYVIITLSSHRIICYFKNRDDFTNIFKIKCYIFWIMDIMKNINF
jgi:hypothetical protein